MSVNLPSLFVQQFALNVQLLLQQKGSKLRGCVMSGSHVGKQASPVDQIGSINMQPVTTRFAPMGRVDAAVDRRWVFPNDYDLPQLIDSFDKLRMLIDPTSSYVQNAVYAAGRQIDSLIVAGLTNNNQTGETAQNTIALPSGQIVGSAFGASADTGLTVAKLRQAKQILMSNNVDMEGEEFYVAVKAKQHDNLLAEAQVISSDFNGGAPVMKEGRVTRFLGINIVHTELVLNNGTYDQVPMWTKSGSYLGVWNDITANVSQRHDLQGLPWQAYIYLTAGATRLEEKKVCNILCA
jgi:Phage capsid protein